MKVELHFKRGKYPTRSDSRVDITIVGDPDAVANIMSLVREEICDWRLWREE